MRLAWVALATALVASSASAEDIVVVATTTSPGARDVLAEMLGPEAVRVEPPAAHDAPALFAWGEANGASLAVLIAFEDGRVYVVLPGTRRLLERVLPQDVAPTDSYAIALAASELIELAHWRDPEPETPPTPDTPPDASVPDPATNPPDPVAGDSLPDEAGDSVIEPPARGAPRLEIAATLGAGGSFGVAPRLPLVGFRLGADLTFARVHLGTGSPFVGLGLVFTVPRAQSAAVGANTIALAYDRRELVLTAGLRYRLGRFELRPSARASLGWVHVAASRRSLGTNAHRTTDDRAALALGLGLESRVHFARRGIVGLDLGLDAMTTRAPYVALGATVLEEPLFRFTAMGTAGIMLIR